MKLTIMSTPILIIILAISSGCINTDDQISWGGGDELKMQISLNYINNSINSSLICLNISIMNIYNGVVYIENRLVFDINIDGTIHDSNNNSFHLNQYYCGLTIPGWEKPEKLHPGDTKNNDDTLLSVYDNEGGLGYLNNVLLSNDEEYTIRCWYVHGDIKVYSNEIIFSPSEWEH